MGNKIIILYRVKEQATYHTANILFPPLYKEVRKANTLRVHRDTALEDREGPEDKVDVSQEMGEFRNTM